MVSAVILAAGSSQRFGDDKRRALLPNGDMVIVSTINTVAESLDHVLVVLRHDDQRFAEQLTRKVDRSSVSYFLAPDSARGMAHSLGNAIQRLSRSDAIMIFLADMPYVQPGTIQALLAAYEANHDSDPIVQPILGTTPGHPVIFACRYFGELETLKGDGGARPVIEANQDRLVRVPVTDEGVLRDIDTPTDLKG